MSNEKNLVQRCISGNKKAQEELFYTYSPTMMGVALRYMGDETKAEDVLQDGFIKVFNYLPRFENKGSLEGWIRRIIVNTALDELRKNKKYLKNINVENQHFELIQKSEIVEKLQADSLMELVQQLPDGYRMVFNLFAIEGFGHREIAKMLNISESTSKTQYLRARNALKKTMEKMGIER